MQGEDIEDDDYAWEMSPVIVDIPGKMMVKAVHAVLEEAQKRLIWQTFPKLISVCLVHRSIYEACLVEREAHSLNNLLRR